MEFLRPDVYVQEVSSGEKPIQAVSTSTGAFIGVTARGEVGVPVLVTSWTDFINKFAKGLSTPFIKGSDLPNAVYGFFQNGGSRCYVVRVASSSATTAKASIALEGLEVKAKDCGAWANDKLGIEVKANSSNFDVNVYMNKELVESFIDVSNTESANNYYLDVINETSQFIHIEKQSEETLATTEGIVKFASGDDNSVSLSDGDFTGAKGLQALDIVSDVNLIAIPSKSEDAVAKALIDYCDKRNDCFAILDVPKGTVTAENAKAFREKLGGTNGAVYFPWGKVIDPIGRNTKSLKECPLCGHIMGMYSNVDNTRGVYKTPAGEGSTLKGVSDLVVTVTKGMQEVLNPIGVNCIIAKPNTGIVVWGGRSLSTDPAKRYVSDVRYDIMVRQSLYNGTQWAIFEPNDSSLWTKVDTSITSFLDSEWRQGALRGESADEAYYVKCDSELNTEESINNGMLVAEIGYAKQKPAEFVVVKIVQKTNS